MSKWYEHLGWDFIIMEGMCLYRSSKDKKMKVCNSDDLFKSDKKTKWKTIKNPVYINPELRPKKCPKHPCYKCYELDCPFLAMSDSFPDIYEHMNKYKFSDELE